MLHFRSLDKSDPIDRIASWIYSTDTFLFDLLFSNDSIRATTGIARLISSDYINPWHHSFITVICDDSDEVLGVCVGYKGCDVSLRQTYKAMTETSCTNTLLIIQNAILNKLLASRIKVDDYYVGNLYVDAEYRDKKLGSKLLEKAKQTAGQSNCNNVCLDVEYDKPYLLDFYAKAGFVKDSKNYHRFLGKTYGCYGLKYELKQDDKCKLKSGVI